MISTPLLKEDWRTSWRTPWRSPAIPEEIQPWIEQMQLQRAMTHVPVIYLVAIFNLLGVMVVSIHEGVEPYYYLWMPVLAVACIARMIMWIRFPKIPDSRAQSQKMLKSLTVVSIAVIVFLSSWSALAIFTDMFADQLFVPMSLVFGSTCIAHCLACVKKVAVALLLIGVVPSAVTMIIVGGFDQMIMGWSMITIVLLMTRFIIDSYNQIISGLIMRHTIWKQAHSDPLTGLANRRAVMNHLQIAEQSFAESGRGFAVALLDLNHFKQVNDNMGHDIGDQLLIEVASRLNQSSTGEEIVGRLGGDEFLIFMPDISDDKQALERATAYLADFARPARIDGHVVTVSASIGVAIQTVDGHGAEKLLKAADSALYKMKRSGKSVAKTGKPPLRNLA